MKKTKWILIAVAIIFLIIIVAGIYKFNYLSSLPSYYIDGNQMPTAEVSIKKDVIYFQGNTNEWDYQALLTAVAKYPNTKFTKMIINSNGGDTVYGRKIATFILNNNLDVEIEEICFSSCANYIFPAGKIKFIQKDAFVGWHGSEHQPLILKNPDQSLEAYNKEMLTKAIIEAGVTEQAELQKILIRETQKFFKTLINEQQFFKTIKTDIALTLLGLLRKENREKYAGWTYSIDDMAKFGLKNIVYLGNKNQYPVFKTGKNYEKMVFIEQYNEQKVKKINQLIFNYHKI